MARDPAGQLDSENMLGRHTPLSIDPRPDMTLPDDLFLGGKEPGQSALASDRRDRGFER